MLNLASLQVLLLRKLQISEAEASEDDFRDDKMQKASNSHGLTGSQGVVAGRNEFGFAEVARTGPKVARASLEYHWSIFWGMGRAWKADLACRWPWPWEGQCGWLKGFRAGLDRASGGPKYHRSMGTGWKAETRHAGSHGHGMANGDGLRWSGLAKTGPRSRSQVPQVFWAIRKGLEG